MSEIPFHYFAIIPSSEHRVLLLRTERGWTLPNWMPVERHYWQDVLHINRHIHEQYGMLTTVERLRSAVFDRQGQEILRVYSTFNHQKDAPPPVGSRWIGSDEVSSLDMEIPEHSAVLEEWFADAARPVVSELRKAWTLPGWFERASSWIRAELQRLGVGAPVRIEQLRTWERSCILRASTGTEKFYFKALPQMFAHELSLTAMLGRRYPGHFASLLAVDEKSRWMLMQDIGHTGLDQMTDLVLWEEALRLYAQIQIDCLPQRDELIRMGCPDRGLAVMQAQIGALLADTSVMMPGHEAGLSEDEIEQLRELEPALKEMCAELASLGVPCTLEHGDFHAQNIMVAGKRIIYFDWSDSCIAHPFFSLNRFFMYAESERWLPDFSPGLHARLQSAYLEPWQRFASPERLAAALDLTRRLGWLHEALIQYHLILPNIEIKWQMQQALPFELKKLLQLMR
jgi:hypothetical protein